MAVPVRPALVPHLIVFAVHLARYLDGTVDFLWVSRIDDVDADVERDV